MKRFEYTAFIGVHADSREEADALVDEFRDAVNKHPDISIGLDDGEPVEEDDEEVA